MAELLTMVLTVVMKAEAQHANNTGKQRQERNKHMLQHDVHLAQAQRRAIEILGPHGSSTDGTPGATESVPLKPRSKDTGNT